MATVQNTFTGDGSTTNFSFTFEYFEEADVKVALDNVDQATTEYSFANATTISFNTAPANNVAIRIYRQTSVDEPKAQFFAGSAIRADDLNDNNTQVRYLAQETENAALSRFGKNTPEADLSMGDHKLTGLKDTYTTTANLDNYTDDTESVSVGWLKSYQSNVIIPRIDTELASALTTEIYHIDGISISDNDPNPGNITIGINDSGIALEKINTDDIVTSTETDYTSTAEGEDDGQAWVGDDTRVATLGALAKRFDNYYSTQTPSGQDYKAGTLHYNPGTAEDPDNTLSIYNGSGWETLVSGVKDFIKQNRLIWVDAALGSDARDGHRVVDPMKTIQGAVNKADDGDMIFVQPGVYKEFLPIDLGRKKNVSIIGLSMRSVFVHPHPTQKWNVTTAGSTEAFDSDNIMTAGAHGNVTSGTSEYETMFQLGSGSFVANMTLAGMKASGARGDLHTDSEAEQQGWFFAFAENDGAGNAVKFQKSPYVQNVTAFADSAIDNTNYQPHSTTNQPAFGGDQTSAPTGGALLVDGSVPHPDSPLRSFLTDAYTLICLDGPGALVRNGGYAQLVSTFGHFCHYHAKAESGGMINMSNCTTDFGRFGLIADGKSSEIFNATTTAAASQGDTTIQVGASNTPFRGQSNPRPGEHMVVEVTYDDSTTEIFPIKNVSGTTTRTITLATALDHDVPISTVLKFYLRSLITTGGHVFEFAGAGTDYTAHPDKGGEPVEGNQVINNNNGQVYISSSDHNGKFKVGTNFAVDSDSATTTITGTATVTGTINYNGTDLVANALVDTTNAANISSGLLPNDRLADIGTSDTYNYPTQVVTDAKGRVTSVSTDEDRFVPEYPNPTDQNKYLSGDGTWQNIPAGSISLDTNQNDNSKVDIEVGTGLVTLDPGLGVSFTRSGDELTIDVSTGTAFADIVTTTPSGSGTTGQLKWNSSNTIPYIYNGSAWVQFAPLNPPYGTGSVSEVIAGTGLTGGVTNGNTTGTINLADTAVTAATYGDSNSVAAFTVDAQGRLTAAANIDISLDASAVTTGVFDIGRIPDIGTNKITGTFNASVIDNGTFNVGQIPNLDAAKITTGTLLESTIPDLSATYLTDLSEDSTPQLGGSLDVDGNSIVSTNNGNVTLNPNGTGVVSFANNTGTTYVSGNEGVTIKPPELPENGSYTLTLPTSDGNNNQVLKTNGSGVLSWVNDADTTYSDFGGADGSNAGTAGLVPAPAATDNTKYLKGDGTWSGITVDVVPHGAIMWWPGNNVSTIPSGWLECNGAILLIASYSALAGVLGQTYKWQFDDNSSAYTIPGGGSYNTATMFQLPDLRGEFIRGFDSNRGIVTDQLLTNNTRAQADKIKNHKHSGGSGSNSSLSDSPPNTNSSAQSNTGFITPQQTASGPDETRPRNLAMIPIIKT